MPDKEFKVMVIKMLAKLTRIDEFSKNFNKERERERETETERDRESDIVVLMCISLMISECSFEIYLIKILPT